MEDIPRFVGRMLNEVGLMEGLSVHQGTTIEDFIMCREYAIRQERRDSSKTPLFWLVAKILVLVDTCPSGNNLVDKLSEALQEDRNQVRDAALSDAIEKLEALEAFKGSIDLQVGVGELRRLLEFNR